MGGGSERTIFVLANSESIRELGNLGDRLLHHALMRTLAPFGTLVVQGELRESVHRKLVTTALSQGRRLGHSVTLVLPPGQGIRKPAKAAAVLAGKLAYLGALRRLGVRILRIGCGLSPQGMVGSLYEAALARNAELYGLRDEAAVRRARLMGIENAEWFPDFSWLVDLYDDRGDRSFERRAAVVVCLRGATEGVRPDEGLACALLDRVSEVVDQARDVGLRDVLIARHAECDGWITERVTRRLERSHRVRRERHPLAIHDIPRVYGSAALVVSNRLHSLLFGVQHGAAALALIRPESQVKVRDQFRDLGLDHCVADVDMPRVQRAAVQTVLDRRRLDAKAVAAYRAAAAARARQTLCRVFGETRA